VAKKLKVTLMKSIIGLSPQQEGTVHALGLWRIRQVVEHDDTPTIRGMISHVVFAVKVEEGVAVAGPGEPKVSRASGSKKRAERSEAKS